jgi:hypothetical protein
MFLLVRRAFDLERERRSDLLLIRPEVEVEVNLWVSSYSS